jgi:hypothetical protein
MMLLSIACRMNAALVDRVLVLTFRSVFPLPRAQTCCLIRSRNQGELFAHVFCLQCMIDVEHVVMASRGRRFGKSSADVT